LPFELTSEDGQFLVKLARRAAATYLEAGKVISVPESVASELREKCGVFVTLNKIEGGKKELRGCIGLPYPTSLLAAAVIESAISSATQDPRFPSVSLDELDHIVFEVSVLTPPELVEAGKPTEYPAKIRVGKDGLIVERGYHKGLLLPQVPVEWDWDEEQFLCQCCLKAGLPPDCWLLNDTKIHRFSCILAQESTPNGPVKLVDMRKG
jgi:uncharacterized protein (TIGR00296 family)